MKRIVIAALACTIGASAVLAEPAGDRPGGDHRGWGGGTGVIVDVPWSAISNGNNSGIPPRSDYEVHCRDVRHSCFGQFGVDEPGYGRCMAARGC